MRTVGTCACDSHCGPLSLGVNEPFPRCDRCSSDPGTSRRTFHSGRLHPGSSGPKLLPRCLQAFSRPCSVSTRSVLVSGICCTKTECAEDCIFSCIIDSQCFSVRLHMCRLVGNHLRTSNGLIRNYNLSDSNFQISFDVSLLSGEYIASRLLVSQAGQA